MIKPNNRPYGRGENKQTGLAPVGNAPLFPLRGTSPGGGSFSGAMLSAAYEMIALRSFIVPPSGGKVVPQAPKGESHRRWLIHRND